MLNSGRDINNRITINETPDQPQFQNLQHEKLRASSLSPTRTFIKGCVNGRCTCLVVWRSGQW